MSSKSKRHSKKSRGRKPLPSVSVSAFDLAMCTKYKVSDIKKFAKFYGISLSPLTRKLQFCDRLQSVLPWSQILYSTSKYALVLYANKEDKKKDEEKISALAIYDNEQPSIPLLGPDGNLIGLRPLSSKEVPSDYHEESKRVLPVMKEDLELTCEDLDKYECSTFVKNGKRICVWQDGTCKESVGKTIVTEIPSKRLLLGPAESIKVPEITDDTSLFEVPASQTDFLIPIQEEKQDLGNKMVSVVPLRVVDLGQKQPDISELYFLISCELFSTGMYITLFLEISEFNNKYQNAIKFIDIFRLVPINSNNRNNINFAAKFTGDQKYINMFYETHKDWKHSMFFNNDEISKTNNFEPASEEEIREYCKVSLPEKDKKEEEKDLEEFNEILDEAQPEIPRLTGYAAAAKKSSCNVYSKDVCDDLLDAEGYPRCEWDKKSNNCVDYTGKRYQYDYEDYDLPEQVKPKTPRLTGYAAAAKKSSCNVYSKDVCGDLLDSEGYPRCEWDKNSNNCVDYTGKRYEYDYEDYGEPETEESSLEYPIMPSFSEISTKCKEFDSLESCNTKLDSKGVQRCVWNDIKNRCQDSDDILKDYREEEERLKIKQQLELDGQLSEYKTESGIDTDTESDTDDEKIIPLQDKYHTFSDSESDIEDRENYQEEQEGFSSGTSRQIIRRNKLANLLNRTGYKVSDKQSEKDMEKEIKKQQREEKKSREVRSSRNKRKSQRKKASKLSKKTM